MTVCTDSGPGFMLLDACITVHIFPVWPFKDFFLVFNKKSTVLESGVHGLRVNRRSDWAALQNCKLWYVETMEHLDTDLSIVSVYHS